MTKVRFGLDTEMRFCPFYSSYIIYLLFYTVSVRLTQNQKRELIRWHHLTMC